MESAMRRARSGNLTALLVVVSLLEFLINRLAGRLFFPRPALTSGGSGSHTNHAVSVAGPFLFQLTAFLALAVMVAAFAGLFRRGELYPRAMRFSTIVIALFFAAVSGWAMVSGHILPQHFLYLEVCFAFLAILTAIAFALSKAPVRLKIGVATFALPGALHALGVVAASLRAGEGHGLAAAVRRGLSQGGPALVRAGEIALLLAGLLAPLLLPPRPFRERRWRVPLAVAAALTAGFVFALVGRFDLMQASALYGLRLELPPLASAEGVAHVLAFFGWMFATIELISDKGGMRLVGYGLVLLALGGYEQASPVELCLSVLGLVAIAVGELRALPYTDQSVPRVGVSEWRAFVGRLAAGVGDGTGPDEARPEAVVVAEGELEVSRIQTHRRGQPVTIKLLRKRGTPVELDASYGNAGHAAADASIERHRRWLARSPEHKLKLPRVKTGDPSFDQKFSVHGAAPLADAELRRRLERQQGDGVLTIWKGSAARYQLSHPGNGGEAPPAAFSGQVEGAAPVQSIVEIVDMLADIVDASLPVAS